MHEEYEILFRPLEAPTPEDWSVPRWQIEYHEYDGIGVPVGLAWVADYGEQYGGPSLLYVLVADGWRRQGIGKRLIRACLERWPNLQMTNATSDEAEFLIASVVQPKVMKDEV